MAKKQYDDDDGRTIFDMSGVERQPLIIPDLHKLKELKQERKTREAEALRREFPKETREEKKTRKSYVFGALGAGLLIGLVYLVVFAVLIVVLLLIWGVL